MTASQARQGNSTSSVLGRRLGAELLKLRTAAGFTQPQAAKVLSASTAKIAKMEGGWVPVRDPDIRALCELYGIQNPGTVGRLLELARLDRERRKAKGWWDDYTLLGAMQEYVTLESAATAIRTWQPGYIPGLFQTPSYVSALRSTPSTATGNRGPDDEFVAARIARQRRLSADPPLSVHALLYEATLRNMPCGADTAREQLDHLARMADSPNITIQMFPFSGGMHQGLNGSFNILSFAESGAMDVVYSETVLTQLWIEGGEGAARYDELFKLIAARSLSERDSLLFLHDLRKDL
ncbi:helix-turn-helix domain-containing protein [Streptomyces sp. NBC_00996]|uniref:helix-turn-helix domain-containing protein n=1 Tax=Streptomyces sp. NBC_00996 TaxID=2903710 RepID=UPI0038689641|nr:helix-turn-helix domain-containing protein [Streptomyces sp. NBC_00996]